MDPILGQIILWPGTFIPEGWAECDGSVLQIQQYQALYSLIGNTYGQHSSTTFALPDLRGRVPVGLDAAGVHLSTARSMGAGGGASSYSTTIGAQAPQAPAPAGSPVVLTLATGQITVPTVPPYLTLRYIIATTGIYPSRP